MEYLFIAEKPSLMREVLACYKRHMPEIISRVGRINFIALAGHVCRNCEPTAYGRWSGNWDEIQYPMVPQQWKIEPIKGKEEMIIRVRKTAAAHEGIIVGRTLTRRDMGSITCWKPISAYRKRKRFASWNIR